MRRVNSTDFKTHFDELVDLVDQVPIEVLRGGKPVGILLSPGEYAHFRPLDDGMATGEFRMRKVVLTQVLLSKLKKLPATPYQQVASAILGLLDESCPRNSQALEVTPNRWLDVGIYRLVYRADGESVHVLIIGKRNRDGKLQRLRRGVSEGR